MLYHKCFIALWILNSTHTWSSYAISITLYLTFTFLSLTFGTWSITNWQSAAQRINLDYHGRVRVNIAQCVWMYVREGKRKSTQINVCILSSYLVIAPTSRLRISVWEFATNLLANKKNTLRRIVGEMSAIVVVAVFVYLRFYFWFGLCLHWVLGMPELISTVCSFKISIFVCVCACAALCMYLCNSG